MLEKVIVAAVPLLTASQAAEYAGVTVAADHRSVLTPDPAKDRSWAPTLLRLRLQYTRGVGLGWRRAVAVTAEVSPYSALM